MAHLALHVVNVLALFNLQRSERVAQIMKADLPQRHALHGF
jgi:hypothetical protein